MWHGLPAFVVSLITGWKQLEAYATGSFHSAGYFKDGLTR